MFTNTLSSLPLLLLCLGRASAIWPVPQTISTGDKVLFIDQTVPITYNGAPLSYTYGFTPAPGPNFSSHDIVQGGISRAFAAIFQQNFVPWKLHARNSDFEPSLSLLPQRVKSLAITQTGTDSPSVFRPLAGQVDESYSLTLSQDGAAAISANTSTGVLHALETFVQLFYQHSTGTSWYTTLAPVSIHDAPKFPHRGLHFDVARNWYPVADIERTIDSLAMNKFNRLHLHVTDSQAWLLDIPALPDLAGKGAYKKGLSYSPEDFAHLQEYAIQRGIELITEIDMPGHIGSVALGYPDLIVAYNEQPYYWWCSEPPCGAFKLNDTAVYDFLDKLWDDLLPRVKPYSAYFHTGGDELNANDSMLDPGIRSNDTDVLQPLLQKFIDTQHARIRKEGLVPIVWEEIPLTWNITLGDDVVVQTWLSSDSVKSLTQAGRKVVDANYNYWYLDCGRGQWLTFQNGEAFAEFYPFNDWCTPTKGWQLMYSYDPTANLTADEAKLVVGGEMAIWSETIDPVNLDSLIWPRGGAVGEILWSGHQDASGQNRSQYDAAPRLADMRERMVARGIAASPVQMIFCTQGNVTDCSYPV